MRIGSLFSGIGGLELGLEMSGLGHTVWQVERDKFCNAVLERNWPSAERFDDVCTVGKTNLVPVDVICGGFPCQDVSGAGKGAGLAGKRSGLWSEYARVVRELRPQWVVVENVASGAVKWTDAVVRELEECGYECLSVPLSAGDVGAPHQRARVFVIAHANGMWERQSQGSESDERRWSDDCPTQRPVIADTMRVELWEQSGGGGRKNREDQAIVRINSERRHEGWSVEPGICPLVHGLSKVVARRGRRARIRSLGNSVVPQQAEVIGWMIREMAGV